MEEIINIWNNLAIPNSPQLYSNMTLRNFWILYVEFVWVDVGVIQQNERPVSLMANCLIYPALALISFYDG